MSGFDQSSIAVSMPTVVGADAALGGPYKIKPSEAFSGALMTVSGLTGETISVQTSPDGYQGAPVNPTFYRTDWQGTQQLFSTARTNKLLFSEDLTNAAWVKSLSTIGSNAILAPDGNLTADKLIANAGASTIGADGNGGVGQSATVLASNLWTLRFWAKAGEVAFVRVREAAATGTRAKVSLTTGGVVFEVGSAASLAVSAVEDSLHPGWWIITCSRTTGGAETSSGLSIKPGIDTGDGTSGVYVWGVDLRQGAFTGGYIKTDATPVTITDYTLSNGVITLAEVPVTGATLSYDNSVLPSPYYIFATGDGVRTQFAYDGVWGTLTANSGKGNGIWQVDLRGAQAYRLVKSAGSETATVNMTLKRDALQYKNSAGTWSVT